MELELTTLPAIGRGVLTALNAPPVVQGTGVTEALDRWNHGELACCRLHPVAMPTLFGVRSSVPGCTTR